MNKNKFTIITSLALAQVAYSVSATESDSVSLRPSIEVEYVGELQSNFKKVEMANLLQLHAMIPFSQSVSMNISSVSACKTYDEPLADVLQGYSNIDADNEPFALSVAGISWNINEKNSIFGGIRRMDEDYFCSDVLSLFTSSSCGGFPTISANFDIAAYPNSAVGVHYAYDTEKWNIQTSIYNGLGHSDFSGRENIFRFCPKSDGVFALAQANYKVKESNYFIGGSLHYSDLDGEASKKARPTIWGYAEPKISEKLSLVAAYSHAFSDDVACNNFVGLGGKYSFNKAQLGLFTNYTEIDNTNEFQTELTCHFILTEHLCLQPAVHVITTGECTKCMGLLRLYVNL